MSSGICWGTTLRRQLSSRGVDEITVVYGRHKVQIGKGSPMRLDEVKFESIPCAGFRKVGKVARGKAGVQQCAGDVLKTLARTGTLDAKPLLGLLKGMQTHCERLGALGQLTDKEKDSQLCLKNLQFPRAWIKLVVKKELGDVVKSQTGAPSIQRRVEEPLEIEQAAILVKIEEASSFQIVLGDAADAVDEGRIELNQNVKQNLHETLQI